MADGDQCQDVLPGRDELYTAETIHKLSTGVLALYQPQLANVQTLLKELTTKQETLIGRMTEENNKLLLCQNDTELRALIVKIACYKYKLVVIKKEMVALHERASKLKKRAVALQQLKENELQKRKLQLKREQDLIGRGGSR